MRGGGGRVKKRDKFASLPTEKILTHDFFMEEHALADVVQHALKSNQRVLDAVLNAQKEIAHSAKIVADALMQRGRIFFVGAGTSGRLGVIESAEMLPTFSVPDDQFVAFIAGGKAAVFRSQEGAEDKNFSPQVWQQQQLSSRDAVIAIAASGITPYVKSALRTARRRKAKTIFISSNPDCKKANVDAAVFLDTGPEILTGSTRLKAATAAKIALNTMTTAAMSRVGKIYRNCMVDLSIRSRKLKERALRLIMDLGRTNRKQAVRLLQETKGNPKLAILMARKNISLKAAQEKLRAADGFLDRALR